MCTSAQEAKQRLDAARDYQRGLAQAKANFIADLLQRLEPLTPSERSKAEKKIRERTEKQVMPSLEEKLRECYDIPFDGLSPDGRVAYYQKEYDTLDRQAKNSPTTICRDLPYVMTSQERAEINYHARPPSPSKPPHSFFTDSFTPNCDQCVIL